MTCSNWEATALPTENGITDKSSEDKPDFDFFTNTNTKDRMVPTHVEGDTGGKEGGVVDVQAYA